MKARFKNKAHKERFEVFLKEKIRNPHISRYELLAALFLLSADEKLWEKSKSAITACTVDFSKINLGKISSSGYTLYKGARAVYFGQPEITVNELCDGELINDMVFQLILDSLLIVRNGISVLNVEVLYDKA